LKVEEGNIFPAINLASASQVEFWAPNKQESTPLMSSSEEKVEEKAVNENGAVVNENVPIKNLNENAANESSNENPVNEISNEKLENENGNETVVSANVE
jgi:hypothetical protein